MSNPWHTSSRAMHADRRSSTVTSSLESQCGMATCALRCLRRHADPVGQRGDKSSSWAEPSRRATLRSSRPPQRCSHVSDPSNAVIAVCSLLQKSSWSAMPARSMRGVRLHTKSAETAGDRCVHPHLHAAVPAEPSETRSPPARVPQPACLTHRCLRQRWRRACCALLQQMERLGNVLSGRALACLNLLPGRSWRRW